MSTDLKPVIDKLDEQQLGILASALHVYADACLMDADMAVGRDEARRGMRLAEAEAASRLLVSLAGAA